MAKYSVLNNTLDFRRTQSQNDCLPASKFEVELELDEVTPWLGRRDRASSTALWTAWDTAEAIDLENSSDMFVFSRAIDDDVTCHMYSPARIMY